MAVAFYACTDESPQDWTMVFLRACVNYYLCGTASTKFTEKDLRICFTPFDLERYGEREGVPPGFGPTSRKKVSQLTLIEVGNQLAEKSRGIIWLCPPMKHISRFAWIAMISRTDVSDYYFNNGYRITALFDEGGGTSTGMLVELASQFVETSWPFCAYLRRFEKLDNEMTMESMRLTEFEKRGQVPIDATEKRLRTGIRGLFWDNVLSEGHLAEIDVDRLRDRFATVGMKVTQLTAPDNTRRVRIQLSGPPRDPNPDEIAVFEEELGHLLPQPQK